MKIVIKNKSELPIYEQIEQQIKNQILDGTIGEDEQLPSIRQLARDLKISVITTTRVYNDLSDEGFIISVAGKGYFVAPRNNDLLKERMLCEMEEGLEKAVSNGRNAGLSDEEIIAALKEYLNNAE
ncbi:MAG: GntR family transcriptional regulator [Ruminococcus sp.]|nr:GntR family transcriptional regulator [Ruminococcus sp.]